MRRIYYLLVVLLLLSSTDVIGGNCEHLINFNLVEVCVVINPKNESYTAETDPFNLNCSDTDFFSAWHTDFDSTGDAFWYQESVGPDSYAPFVKNQTYEIQISALVDAGDIIFPILHPTMELQWYEAGYGGFEVNGFTRVDWEFLPNGNALWSTTFEFTPTRNTIDGSTWSPKGLKINLMAIGGDAQYNPSRSISTIIPYITTGPVDDQIAIQNTSVTPSVPYLVLHDPPGDQSFSSMTANVEHCQTVSWSTKSENEVGAWLKAKVGAKVSNSFLGLAEVETEVYASATGSFKMNFSQNQAGETERCIQTSTTFSTSSDNNAISGDRGDVFIGKATLMSMGLAENISYNCGDPEIKKELVIAPSGVDSEFAYTEGHIRYTLMPELEQTMNQTSEDSGAHKTAKRQWEVWQQALATNDALKNKPYTKTIDFSANAEKNEVESVQTTEINSIETSIDIDMNLAIEAGIEIAGNGVSGGANIRMRTETGFGSSSSNNTTNSISYTLSDGDQVINGPGSDNFTVGIIHDGKHGTPAFVLVDGETSCPYEGGYRIDQPDFKFGDGSKMLITFGEIGETLVVPVQICNLSKYPRNYRLKLETGTNSNGLIINVGGTTLNSTDEGHFFGSVPAEGCEETNLIISAPNESITEFPNIEIYLYACSEDTTQDGALISSSGTLTVNFQQAAPVYNSSCAAISLPSDGTIQGPFTNSGANAENDESIIAPPGTGCETNNGWCMDDVQIQNSVWFTFIAPATGEVSVSTCDLSNFDTQIAVYASSNCSDFGTYTLLGANDDGPSSCATDFDSYLELTDLNPGETYFVLVDGYEGAFGEFNIAISTIGTTTNTKEMISMNQVKVFPNPATDAFSIESAEAFDQLQLFTASGELVLNINDPDKINSQSLIQLPALNNGLYMGILRAKNQNYSFKLSIFN